MPVYKTFSHPLHDMGAATNYRLPARFLRPVIAALICSHKGHAFDGYGTVDGSWHWETEFRVCSRCAMRRFENIPSQKRFDELLRGERARVKKALAEDLPAKA